MPKSYNKTHKRFKIVICLVGEEVEDEVVSDLPVVEEDLGGKYLDIEQEIL